MSTLPRASTDFKDAWRVQSHKLAKWARRYFVRRDRYGGYHRKDGVTKPSNKPPKGPEEDVVTLDLLERHFRATKADEVIGAHTLAPSGEGLWVAIDIDAHDGTDADAEANERFAWAIHEEVDALGLCPLTYDSNGKGGYHVVVFFADVVPGPVLFAFARWLVRRHAEFGFDKPPETFPKQRSVAEGGYGNWFRVIGRHHTRDIWPRVWSGGEWLSGEDAVAHVLSVPRCAPNLIPFDALITGAVEAPEPPPPVDAVEGRPGDDFNRRGGEPAMRELLGRHGWKLAHERGDGATVWTRPGKAEGCSGTLGHCTGRDGGPLFYCWTTNAPHLESNKTYSAFTLLTALDHGGDFGEAASALRKAGYGADDSAIAPRTKTGAAKRTPPNSAVEVLVKIGLEDELFHDPKGDAYAAVGRRAVRLRSKQYRQHLTHQYRTGTGGKVPSSDALANAVAALEAAAVIDGEEHPVPVRIAGHEGRVYLHLADAADTVIEIDADGWRECPDPPVRFRRPSGQQALPIPQPGGDLGQLRTFLNVPDDDGFALVVAWLTGCFRPEGPFPLLVLVGEQGSAKSTTARVVKQLLDPTGAPVRSEPKEERDLMIQARNAWIMAYDNLSRLPAWLSDALCRLATGGGFATRELYTDEGEIIFDAKRPVTLNGITDFVERPDLLERALLIRHPPIPESRRRPESEFWAGFNEARPAILGALLDRVVGGLRAQPRGDFGALPRMADFALFAMACERGAGEEPRFAGARAANQAGAHEQALEASPLPAALDRLMAGEERWEGTPSALLAALGAFAPDPAPRDWPKKPNVLTGELRRLVPDLRRARGLNVDCDGRRSGAKSSGRRTRVIRITLTPTNGGKPSSPIVPPQQSAREVRLTGGTMGDDGGRSAESAAEDRPPLNARKNMESGEGGTMGDGLSPRLPAAPRAVWEDNLPPPPRSWRGPRADAEETVAQPEQPGADHEEVTEPVAEFVFESLFDRHRRRFKLSDDPNE